MVDPTLAVIKIFRLSKHVFSKSYKIGFKSIISMNIINLGIYLIVGNVPFTLNELLKPMWYGVGYSLQVNVGGYLAPARTGLMGPILSELVCVYSMWFNPRAFRTMVKCWPKVGIGFVWVCFKCF